MDVQPRLDILEHIIKDLDPEIAPFILNVTIRDLLCKMCLKCYNAMIRKNTAVYDIPKIVLEAYSKCSTAIYFRSNLVRINCSAVAVSVSSVIP